MILLDETHWEIKETQQRGKGVFAKKDLAPGIIIGDYIGKVIKTAEEDTSEKNGLYLLYYHDYASLYPEDITKPGIHMVNHSCVPNCWIYTYKGHTLFFTLRKIFAGEELTISYLLSPDDYCDPCTHTCFCGSTFCTKTMHLTKEQFLEWNMFNENESKKTKRAPIRYGKILSKLKEYPEEIADNAIYTLFGTTQKPAQQYKDTQQPSLDEIRKRLRNTGRFLTFPNLKVTILGVKNNKLISA